MRKGRSEQLYLLDIVETAAAIRRFVGDLEHDEFLHNDLTRSAVLQKLTEIGEAAARLSSGFRQRHSAIDWVAIVGFRNRAVHAYFAIDWSIVWVAATQETPDLAQQVETILAEEFPEARDANSGTVR